MERVKPERNSMERPTEAKNVGSMTDDGDFGQSFPNPEQGGVREGDSERVQGRQPARTMACRLAVMIMPQT